MSVAIRVDDAGKRYRRMSSGFRLRTLKSALLQRSLVRGLAPEQTIAALDAVSFEVAAGEAFGVIGGNGSGKSTLLKLVAGLIKPTAGTIEVSGRVAALIELGAGFHPEISGRENVYINATVLGLGRRQIEKCYEQIVEFSGLGDFIEEPVKNYSSGMYVRLGFAVAIHTDPEVLLVDEVLAVGDQAFSRRCLSRIEEHLERGRTLLVVSHDLDLVEHLCDRVMWLDEGRVRGMGAPRQVIDAYRQEVARREGHEHQTRKEEREQAESAEDEVLRWGSRQATIEKARLLVDGAESYTVPSGSAVTFEVDAEAHEELRDFVFGVAITTPRGIECWGTNTDLGGWRPRRLFGSARVRLSCPELRLAAGEYLVDVAVHARDGSPYDYRRRCFRFTVSSSAKGIGVYSPEHRWSFAGGVQILEPEAR